MKKHVGGSNTHFLGLSFICLKKQKFFFSSPPPVKRTKLLLAAASQGSEPQQLIQEAKGDINGGEGPCWRGEELEKARMGMVVAAAQRTDREAWPVATRCSWSCVRAS